MEVHHHPQVEKKGFKEYFLEFLMIFLAVTLGFFAEGLRENVTDHTKEKEFMRSMVQDLCDDTTTSAKAIDRYTQIYKEADTILMCLKSDRQDASVINRLLSHNFWLYTGYSYNNRTMQQLKNAGNFRLIKNKAVADSILYYDNLINSFVLNQYNDLKSTLFSYKDAAATVVPYKELSQPPGYYLLRQFDPADFAITNTHTFISNNKELLSLYYNRVFIHEALCHTFIVSLQSAKQYAERLLKLIQKEYHLN